MLHSCQLENVCEVNHSGNLHSQDNAALCLSLNLVLRQLLRRALLEQLKISNHHVEGGNRLIVAVKGKSARSVETTALIK
jgi:hypothetical protein